MDGSSFATPEDSGAHSTPGDGQPRALNPKCVREYDIRGIVDRTLTADDVRVIGRAYGTIVAASGGRDALRLMRRTLFVQGVQGGQASDVFFGHLAVVIGPNE